MGKKKEPLVKCSICAKEKPVPEFPRNGNPHAGYRHFTSDRCKPCNADYQRELRQKKKDRPNANPFTERLRARKERLDPGPLEVAGL